MHSPSYTLAIIVEKHEKKILLSSTMKLFEMLSPVEKFRKYQAEENKHNFSESAIPVSEGSIQMNITFSGCF